MSAPESMARLAKFFAYPEGDFMNEVEAEARGLEASAPEIAEDLAPFIDTLRPLSPEEREELYTRTFDISPVCCLEVGWHLYGERYERGSFLVMMRALLRRHGVAESTELPDHLTSVLAVLDRLPPEEASPLKEQTATAVGKMLAGIEKGDRANPYGAALRAVRRLLTPTPASRSAAVMTEEVSHGV